MLSFPFLDLLQRREALGLAPGITDPFLDTVDDNEWIFPEEPEELRVARARLSAYQALIQEEKSLPGIQRTVITAYVLAP